MNEEIYRRKMMRERKRDIEKILIGMENRIMELEQNIKNLRDKIKEIKRHIAYGDRR